MYICAVRDRSIGDGEAKVSKVNAGGKVNNDGKANDAGKFFRDVAVAGGNVNDGGHVNKGGQVNNAQSWKRAD